jgi:hypothetical protein
LIRDRSPLQPRAEFQRKLVAGGLALAGGGSLAGLVESQDIRAIGGAVRKVGQVALGVSEEGELADGRVGVEAAGGEVVVAMGAEVEGGVEPVAPADERGAGGCFSWTRGREYVIELLNETASPGNRRAAGQC